MYVSQSRGQFILGRLGKIWEWLSMIDLEENNLREMKKITGQGCENFIQDMRS